MKLINWSIFVFVILFFSLNGVYAQSQDDVNPLFNPSSEEEKYIQFNYDCSGLPWPTPSATSKRAVKLYRRFEGDTVNTYYVYEGETVVGIESDTKKFDDETRKLPTPILIPKQKILDEIFTEEERANDPVKLKTYNDVSLHAGRVMCGPNVFTENDVVKSNRIIENGLVVGFYNDVTQATLVPPTLQQLENFFLDAVFIAYSFLGIYVSVNLFYLGFQYMTQGVFSPEKKGNVLSKIALWIVGVVGLFIAIPALTYFYQLLGIQHTKCFYYEEAGEEKPAYDLTLPGFTFFFKDVCTGPYSIQE